MAQLHFVASGADDADLFDPYDGSTASAPNLGLPFGLRPATVLSPKLAMSVSSTTFVGGVLLLGESSPRTLELPLQPDQRRIDLYLPDRSSVLGVRDWALFHQEPKSTIQHQRAVAYSEGPIRPETGQGEPV